MKGEEGVKLSPTLALLEKKLRERGVGDKAFGMRPGMRPIWKALEEMDKAGVKVRTAHGEKNVLAIHNLADVDRFLKTSGLNLTLWNLEKRQLEEIRLGEDEKHPGEYMGGLLTPHGDALARRKRPPRNRTQLAMDRLESKHFETSEEAIAWLVEKIAPCVVEANRLGLAEGDPGPPSAWPN
jgi:hypothetical protein